MAAWRAPSYVASHCANTTSLQAFAHFSAHALRHACHEHDACPPLTHASTPCPLWPRADASNERVVDFLEKALNKIEKYREVFEINLQAEIKKV